MRYEVNPKKLILPRVVSFDTEFTDLNLRKADFLSASVGVSEDLTYIFDKSGLFQLNDILQKAEIVFCWNMVVDWYVISHRLPNGIFVQKNKILDVMLMEHLVDERLTHSLGDFALREYNDDYKKIFWSKYSSYQEAPKEEACEYEMRDGCYTYRAGIKYLDLLKQNPDLVQHVHRLQWALFGTEIKGLRVNTDLMIQTKSEMGGKISEYLPKLRSEYEDYIKIWELSKWKLEIGKRKSDKGKAGVPRPVFSFTSDKQLSELLYGGNYLNLPVTGKTKKGNPSTSSETLAELSESHPEIRGILEYKETKAVYATFVEGMLDRVDEGRIYPGFFINGTTTGRISHNNPNMGNLPKEGVIRNFFIPDENHSIIGADYSQLEVVVEANLTEDPSLLKIILEGASKHDITAEGLGIPRDQAKTLNFALQYGAGIHKISKLLSVSHSSAAEIFERYWMLYAGVKALKDQTTKELEDQGYVTNLFGRVRHFDKPENEFEKAKQERQAYNFKIQGVGADITNRATYLVAEEFSRKNLGRLWFSVHDEIITEARNDCIDSSKNAIVECMNEPNNFLKLKYRVESKLYGPFSEWRKT